MIRKRIASNGVRYDVRLRDPRKLTISRANQHIGGRSLEAVTTAHVQEMMSKLIISGLSPTASASILRVVRACFNEAVRREMLTRNPCRGVRVAKGETRPHATVAPDVVDSLADEVGPEWRAAVLLGGIAGLRIGEVFGLKVRDIDFARRTISVERQAQENGGPVQIGPPKTAAGIRTLALPDRMLDELAEHLQRRSWSNVDADADRFLFGTGDALSPGIPSNFRHRIWDPARRSVGLPTLRFHDLRHGAVTMLVAAGADPKTVQNRLGHASLSVTLGIYAKATTAADRAAADHLQELFGTTDPTAEVRPRPDRPRHVRAMEPISGATDDPPKSGETPDFSGVSECSGGGARTHDPLINSQLLCQLSYPGSAGTS